uniref:Serine carboxypeptidase n=1 Tax=Peronospora matthiolae TaxID=2874970 RepID=A0AAV1V2M8_9STRA
MRQTSEMTPLVPESTRLRRRFALRPTITHFLLLTIVGFSLLFVLVVHETWPISTVTNLKGTIKFDEVFCGPASHETGYLKLPNTDNDHYFYWFVESQTAPQKDPLVLWLTGGPGCSSLMAILAENGPCRVQSDLSTVINPSAWNNQANDKDSNEVDVAENICWFLQAFFKKHPDLNDREFFLTSDSFGGHYVPATTSHILKANMLQHLHPNASYINLAGIAIGNGLTDPAVQYQHSVDMAFKSYNVTLLQAESIEGVRKAQPVCHKLNLKCQRGHQVNGAPLFGVPRNFKYTGTCRGS